MSDEYVKPQVTQPNTEEKDYYDDGNAERSTFYRQPSPNADYGNNTYFNQQADIPYYRGNGYQSVQMGSTPYYGVPTNSVVGNETISVLSYLGHVLLWCIPFVGLVCMIITALAEKRTSLRNFAIAELILSAAVVVIYVIMMVNGVSFQGGGF